MVQNMVKALTATRIKIAIQGGGSSVRRKVKVLTHMLLLI